MTAGLIENKTGTLDEAIRIAAKVKQDLTVEDIVARAECAIRLAVAHGTSHIRTHVDVDGQIGLKAVEAMLLVKEKCSKLIDMQIVAFPQEGILSNPRVKGLLEESISYGVDAIGGIPTRDTDSKEHIDYLLELGQKSCLPLDMHVDESDNPGDFTLPYLAKRIRQVEFDKPVTVGHLCSLSAVSERQAIETIELVAQAGIHVVTLPTSNLYLQGRQDDGLIRRGITRVKDLLKKGVNLAVASDNVADPFFPLGDYNLMKSVWLISMLAQINFSTSRELVLNLVTHNAARIMGLTNSYGTGIGSAANLVLYPTSNIEEIVGGSILPELVIKDGEIVFQRKMTFEYFLEGGSLK